MNSASYTLNSFIADVRNILRDTAQASYHWTDMTILGGICDALVHMNALRPTTRYDVNGALNDYEFPSTEQQLKAYAVFIPVSCRLGIVYFAAARCFESDITDTVNMQLSISLKQQAEAIFK